MVCRNPKTLWYKNNWDLDIKLEYLHYKEENKKRNPKWTTNNLRKLKNTFKEPHWSVKHNYTPIQIPCGCCKECRLEHANMWATRIYMESTCWKKSCFVTLTYNEENLPKNKQLVKKHMQDFFKRLLKLEEGHKEWENPINGKIEKPIRRFYCGEYGDKNKRPHYHAAIFNWEPNDLEEYKQNKWGNWLYKSKKLQKIWGHGFVIIGKLTYESSCYIARYVQKKAGISYRRIPKELKNPNKIEEFLEMSRKPGIGLKYWQDNKGKIKRNGGIFIKLKEKVTLKKIPRYFRKIWEIEYADEYYKWLAESRSLMKKELEKVLARTDLNEEEYRKVQARSLDARTKTLIRDNFI